MNERDDSRKNPTRITSWRLPVIGVGAVALSVLGWAVIVKGLSDDATKGLYSALATAEFSQTEVPARFQFRELKRYKRSLLVYAYFDGPDVRNRIVYSIQDSRSGAIRQLRRVGEISRNSGSSVSSEYPRLVDGGIELIRGRFAF